MENNNEHYRQQIHDLERLSMRLKDEENHEDSLIIFTASVSMREILSRLEKLENVIREYHKGEN